VRNPVRRRTLRIATVVFALALPAAALPGAGAGAATYTTKVLTAPDRVAVYSGKALVATFTYGSRTVTFAGASRTFTEPSTTTATVTTTTWVRLLDAPFAGTLDAAWVTARRTDTSPDILARAMQYIVGASAVMSGSLQIAGDAAYGPLQPDGTRAEGSDFNDYLGLTWSYPGGITDPPEADQFRSLDCSGYMRMVLGYRSGVPMSIAPAAGTTLPRRAFEQEASGPGITVIPNTGAVPASRAKLAPGDLVFFDAATDDGTRIDHVGMYLGRDNGGRDRFISSRKTANGPTLGDAGGRSVLDGTGLYALSFRSARRI